MPIKYPLEKLYYQRDIRYKLHYNSDCAFEFIYIVAFRGIEQLLCILL